MEGFEIGTLPAAKVTPMLAQYLEIKKGVEDAVLFYRMGDFYEMFFEDAVRAAPILGVQLTSRDKGASDPIPMCGVPHHAVLGYVQKLIDRGFKVALCEQVGDPPPQKGLLKREVTRIITPGLVANPDLIQETSTHYLMAVDFVSSFSRVGLLDLMSGRLAVGEVLDLNQLRDLVAQFSPKEILLGAAIVDDPRAVFINSLAHVARTHRPAYFVSGGIDGAIGQYVRETQGGDAVAGLGPVTALFLPGLMRLDSVALKALEILESHSPDVKGASLFESLDRCETAVGRRLLREWLSGPLCDEAAIQNRLDAVEYWVGSPLSAEGVCKLLRGVRDLERLATKTALGLAQPPDLLAIRNIQVIVPGLRDLLTRSHVKLLVERGGALDPLAELTRELGLALKDEVPVGFRDGAIFRDDYRAELQELRSLNRNAKALLLALEERERRNTGISSLKVRFNRVFGYSIEITRTHLTKIPAHFIRRQTLANAERFITEELTELEAKILSAEERLKRLEEELFLGLRSKVAAVHSILKANARIVAEIDVLLGFSQVARERGYVKPKIHKGWALSIIDGRHPVGEALMPRGTFVPNSICFDGENSRTFLVTGPNMAGKSTIMRQVALTSVLAQCGSFVPCREAILPVVDGIFTRVGASDDLASGRSTFMVEMTEMSRLLNRATERSLIIIDEIGRGTSTYDGLSLAWSLLEFLHCEVRAKTLFATHFHELTALERSLAGLVNTNVLVKKVGDEIVFLHRLDRGACSQSYGIDVARLAGLPPKVLLRAKEIAGVLETQSARGNRMRSRALEVSDKQMGLLELI